MWSKLRSRMLSLYPGFSRSPIACKRKFNTLVRQYKKDMHSGEERHNCKHYGLLDQWLHNSGSRHHNNSDMVSGSGDVLKNVSKVPDGALVPYNEEDEERELENGDSIFGSLTKMAEVSNEIVHEMTRPSLLDKMDTHLDPPLIDNLKLTSSK